MALLDFLGTPNEDKAMLEQGLIEQKYRDDLAKVAIQGVESDIASQAAADKRALDLSKIFNNKIRATGQHFLNAERIAKMRAGAGPTGEAGRSTQAGKNASLKFLGALAQSEAQQKHSHGEGAWSDVDQALRSYAVNHVAAKAKGGIGVGGKFGVRYESDLPGQLMKAGKIAMMVGSMGSAAGVFGSVATAGGGTANATMFDAIFNKSGITGPGTFSGGDFSKVLGSYFL